MPKKKKGTKSSGGTKSKKKVKIINIDNSTANKLDLKKMYMRSSFNSCYLDNNNVGDVYFSLDNPNKWEFKATDMIGAYTIKSLNTNLLLTTNEKGEIFTTYDLDSSYQKWYVYNTDTKEIYLFKSVANDLIIKVSPLDEIYLDEQDENNENNQSGLFNSFVNFPKK